MKFFRPRSKELKFKIKREVIQSLGVATLLCALIGIASYQNFHSKAATGSDGNWYDCNGQLDNDPAHHTTNSGDMDPAHHLGQVCNGTAEAWTPNSASVSTSLNQSEIVNPIQTVTSDTPATVQMPPAMTESISRAKARAKQSENTPTVSTPPVTNSVTTNVSNNNSNDPFAGAKLYINSNNDPANYVRNNSGSHNAQLMSKISNQPEVEWLGGWNTNVGSDVANMMNTIDGQGALPVFVVYNLPNRDCGGYSQGGANDMSTYNSWVSQIANAIGNRKAAVILEPDATSLTDCLNSDQLSQRYQMLQKDVSTFKALGNTSVYIDAGHPNWISASDEANRLKQAGIDQADGFALNIANFYSNQDNISYGTQISNILGGKHFIVDTGRNGSGTTSDNQWCNPSGRSLGTPPTTNTGNPLVDAYLWVKGPGGSDGNCNGGPSAGQFWPDYALGLAQRTNW